MTNELIKLLEAFPDKRWNYAELAANPNISMKYIDDHPNGCWATRICNGGASISRNPNLTFKYLWGNTRFHWKWYDLSCNPGITLKVIEKYPEYPWNWDSIGIHPNITLKFILKHVDKINTSYLGGTKNISLQDIENYPNLFHDKLILSKNPNLTTDFVKSHPGKWDYYEVAQSPMITLQDAIDILDWFETKEIHTFSQYCSQMFMHGFCKNHYNFTPNILRNFKINSNNKYQKFCRPINWTYVCENASFTIKDIEELVDKQNISILGLLKNPNITYEWVVENMVEIDKENGWFWFLSKNQFGCHPYFDTQSPVCYV